MNTYTIKWQRKDKYLPLQRNTVVKANFQDEAKKALFKAMKNEKTIEILEVTEEK